MVTPLPTLRLTCPICVEQVTFLGEQALRGHLSRIHFQCLPYPCTLCAGTERFPTEVGLRHHVEIDHGVREYQVSPTLHLICIMMYRDIKYTDSFLNYRSLRPHCQ